MINYQYPNITASLEQPWASKNNVAGWDIVAVGPKDMSKLTEDLIPYSKKLAVKRVEFLEQFTAWEAGKTDFDKLLTGLRQYNSERQDTQRAFVKKFQKLEEDGKGNPKA